MSDPPVSLRGGKFYPSQRYKPEQGYIANVTNWRFGPPDKTSYVSTMREAQSQSASVPPHELALRQPRMDKNASDKVAIQGGGVVQPRQYENSYKAEFHPGTTALSSAYVKEGPAYDRISSCKTNYSLGEYRPPGPAISTTHSHHPYKMPTDVQQANIGGWKRSDGSYHCEHESNDSIVRGGGGGEGSLGVQFNIVNNASDPGARDRVAMRTGARVSVNKREPWSAGCDAYGDPGPDGPVNIFGKARQRPQAPPHQTAQALLRPDHDVLRTRPW
uniref:Uncharacterized protein n=1 Tax=Florenciella parvula TaxID=236787 RepID=A0A7S2F937_9STRA